MSTKRAAKRTYPKEITIVLYDLDGGYPRGGVGIEAKGRETEMLPSGVYVPTHACKLLLDEGWPPDTVVGIRGSRTTRLAYGPLPLWSAAGFTDRQLSMKVKQSWPGEAEAKRLAAERFAALPADVQDRRRAKAAEKAARKPAPKAQPTPQRKPPTGSSRAGGIARPTKPGAVFSIWELADRFDGDKAQVLKAATDAGLKSGTVGVQLSAWRRYKTAGGV